MKKRMLSLFLAITMVLQLCSTMAFAVEADGIYASGEAGMLSWVVTDDGTLTISGNGGMDIYEEDASMYSTAPWGWCAPVVEKIIIEEGVMSVGPYAFVGFDKLRYAEIPDSVMMVDSYAFYRQSGEVPTIILFKGDTPDYIGSMAFAQRYNTYGVYMEGQSGWAEEIGDYYANINWLSMDEHGIIEEGTCGENHTWKIALDGTMTISGSGRLEGGFWTIAPYTRLVIEEGTTAIGDYAFCMLGNLTSVVIPPTVTSIGERAFDECYNIADITFKGNAPTIHEFAFNYAGYYNGTTVYYPADNPTWIPDVLQNYGGDLIWIPVQVGGNESGGDVGTEDSGSIGGTEPPADNITWSLDDGVLTISGNGPMPDYTYDEETGRYNTPWHDQSWRIDHVVIGDGITSIGANTLSGMTGLEKLTIGASVEAIAENVFSKAWYLEEIIVSAANTHYGMKDGVLCTDDGTELVFYPYSLEDTAYTIPDGVQKIAPYAFCWTSGDLTSVTIPEGVTTIGASAFSDLQLEELDLPESLKTIGSFAFYGCTMTEVTIPANVEFIGTAAFGYTWLEEVTFEGDAPIMECGPEEQIFEDVEATVYYPANNPTWTEEARQNYGGNLTWTPVGGSDTPEAPAEITWSLDGTTLTISGSGAMPDYTMEGDEMWSTYNTPWADAAWEITEVIIGNGITSVGAYTFGGMSSLEKLTLGASVAKLPESPFSSCYGLCEIKISPANTHFCVVDGALLSGDRTELICYLSGNDRPYYTIPSTVRKIADHAFYNASYELTRVLFPDGLESVGDYAFYYKGLSELALPMSLRTIGRYAFYGNNMTQVVIPDGVEFIDDSAFGNNYDLTSVIIGSGLTGMGSEAFGSCSNLSSIQVMPDNRAYCAEENILFTKNKDTLLLYPAAKTNTSYTVPDSVRTIAAYAFYSNSKLTEVILPDGLETIGAYAFFYARYLAKADLPDSVTVIAPYAFGNTMLTEVVIPDGVQTIGASAYAYAPLTTATIGRGVTAIEERAFSGCTKLNEITFRGNGPTTVGPYAFSSVRATAYYPANDPTWTEEVMQSCGGNLTWEATQLGGTDPEPPMAGSCGDNLTWRMDGGTLIISGSGAMYDYQGTGTPWDKTIVQEVVFDENCTITYIGTAAFADCTGLTAIDIPDTVEVIATEAFRGCSNLASVTLPEELTIIGGIAFAYCTNLTEITVPAKVTSISNMAFALSGLETITMEGSEPALGSFVFQGCTLTTYAPWITWSSNQWGNVIYNGPVLDTTAPVLTITGPENGSRVWGSAVLEVSTTDEDENVTITVDGAVGETVLTAQQRGDQYTFYLTGLSAEEDGKTLTITVTAQDSAGNTAAETLSYIIDNVPNPVTGLTAESREDGVYLSWIPSDPEDNVLGYEIHRQTADTSEKLVTFSFGIQEYKDTDVQNGKTYIYTVSAFGANLSPVSTAVTLTYTWDETAPVITEIWPATADKVTFCHDGTLQMVATDDRALDYAEFYAGDVLIGSADFNASGIASLHWDCSELSGEVTLTYVAYDKAGNTAETTAEVTVRPYTRPVTPADLTAEAGFRSGVLTWTYDGDLQTLKQFNIYDGDPDGGMLITSVRGYQYAIRDLEEPVSYKVAAVDIYGNQSFSTSPVTVTPILTENVPPKAVLAAQELTAVTGTPITLSGANSTDNDAIASYTWDFGDGTTAEGVYATHTYTKGGTYTVILTVTDRSGNSDTVRAEITVLDTLSEDATHTRLTVTVRNSYAAGTPGIAGATVTVFSDGYEGAALTDSRGTATLVVPKGQHTLTVVKDGFDGKMQEINIQANADGETALTLHLAPSGVDVVGGDLKVEPMTREEIEEAGIDMNDPANNHVVKQSTTIRFQPMPEIAFDIPIEQILNAVGDLLGGTGFGWHTFTPDPPKPDDPEEDDDDDDDNDEVVVGILDPIPPKYDVGVFPVGDSAFMVIYGQTHWLKEMFNVELIVFNNSYVDDLQDVSAQLHLPKGLSLAAMLEGDQTEKVDLGTIERKGTAEDTSVRQVNWYVRGDAEGEYNLTALVNGYVGGAPFEKTFTAEEAIKVYAGSALKLTVTMPKSAYAEKEYAVKFSLTNVSDKPIYNLSFGLDSAQQFVAERMSDGSTGEVEREYSNEDFEGGMTYGLPTLEPGKAFNLILKTTFEHEHQFLEWAVGKIPLDVVEVGYQVADCFVTTLEGSTTEIPVEIILEDVKKDDLFQWIWDETVGAFKDGVKDKVIELIDDKIFQGVPVAEKGVEIFEVVTNIKDEITDPDAAYIPTVNVTEGVQCVPKNEVDDWLSAFDTYSLRRSAAPGVLVWTDAADAVISEDGRSMTMPSGGKLYTLRLGETAVTPEIDVTTYYVDMDGCVQPFTYKLTTDQAYVSGLQNAKHILLEQLTENTFEIPTGEEIVEVGFDGWLIGEKGEILRRASNENWTVEGEKTTGLTVTDGKLMVDSTAYAGTYTVKLTLDGTEGVWEQTITLTGGHRSTYEWQGDQLVGICSCGEVTEYLNLSYDRHGIFMAYGELPEDLYLYGAAYTADGRMIDGFALHTPYAYAYPEAAVIRIFAVDRTHIPIFAPKEMTR